MINNFPNERMRHCETGIFVNMMKYYGYEISEPMAFGIGAGLYFLYAPFMKVKGTIFPILRSKPTRIVGALADRLHFNCHIKEYGDNVEKASRELDELIDRNIPVGIVVNVNGLPYFNASGTQSDFNGHVMCAVGKEGSTYIIADTDSRLNNNDYVNVELDVLKKIRFAPGFSAPQGKIFYFDPLPKDFEQHLDLKKAIDSGMAETCAKILNLPLPYYGWTGLHCFANDIRKWDKKFPEKTIHYILFWYYRLIERSGTGGAAYRFIYADFLKEAAEYLQNDIIDDCAKKMSATADKWRLFSLNCRRFLKQDNVSLTELADIMDEISDGEHQVFYKIKHNYLKPMATLRLSFYH